MTFTVPAPLRWIGKNLGLTLGLALFGAALGAIYQAKEAPASAYNVIEQNWSRLTPATQRAIADDMHAHGRIRNWDYPVLFDAMLNDTNGIVMPQADDDTQAARERVIHLVQLAGQGGGKSPS